ncbi:1,4-dihydroxy-2-naphthoate polyprenyltransferase [Halocatena marina]|uniref:1,4-dihydroxy-2-naphthoate polyprenyltransferase n=1 Tax=Halocatena marina TaxID=2934937 RepID=UPI00200D5EBF|nr:1,4-dihydroxy-2-naphthoate polyprenyltransferase [Halocatena marina]
MTEVSRKKAWLMAARPQTLPAGASPVVVGIGLAIESEVFSPIPALAALLGALLIQIGTNFANDYYDAVKGADTDEREGFTRVTQSGLIRPAAVKRAMYGTFAVAILTGVYLVYVGGLPILIVGLSSVAAGLLYTGGPYPYGYRGLGDLFVFVFFGLVAVTGTYYVQATAMTAAPLSIGIPPETVPTVVVLASLPAAGLSTTILVVNNIRDRETDAKTGKRTLAVMLGYRWSRIEFLSLIGLAYVVPIAFALIGYSLTVLLPLLTLPLAISLSRTVLTKTSGDALNPALETTGKLLAAHSVLFAVGFALA